MQKKIGLIFMSMACLMLWVGIFQVRQHRVRQVIPYRRELPITTKTISMDHNRYGDYLAGIIAQSRQDYIKTVEYYERALKNDPDNTDIKVLVYVLNVLQGRMEQAVPQAEELKKLNQGQLLTEYVIAVDYIKNKKYDQALKVISQKSNYGLDQVLVPITKAWILAGQGQYKQADDILKTQGKDNAAFAYYRALLAMMFSDQGSVQKQIEQMNRLSKDGYPSMSAVLFLRDYYQKQNQWQIGQKEYDKIEKALASSAILKDLIQEVSFPEKITPEIGLAIGFYDVSVGLMPLKLKETTLMLNSLAIDLYPQAVIPKIWGAELFEEADNHELANRLYRQIESQSDVVLLKMILNEVARKEYQNAEPLCQKLVRNNPEDAFIQALMGDILMQLKKYTEAVPYYQKAYNLFKTDNKTKEMAETLGALAGVYDLMGDPENRVEETLVEALKLDPHQASVLNFLGYRWLEENKNIDEACRMVEEAHQLMPEEGAILDSLAFGYYRQKEYQKALDLAERATDKLPFSSVAYGHLGDIYAALGRNREAIYQYRRALTLDHDMSPKLKSELNEKLSQMGR